MEASKMNRRGIKAVLERKHKEFVATIKDEKVRKLVNENSIITGGCIASLLLREKVNDFDYYFTNKETVMEVAKYYVAEFVRLNPTTNIRPIIVETDDGRIKIKIQNVGITSETVDDANYQYFEGRPLDEGETYVQEACEVLDAPVEAIEQADEGKCTKPDGEVSCSGYTAPETSEENDNATGDGDAESTD